jgi:hypothetical protein
LDLLVLHTLRWANIASAGWSTKIVVSQYESWQASDGGLSAFLHRYASYRLYRLPGLLLNWRCTGCMIIPVGFRLGAMMSGCTPFTQRLMKQSGPSFSPILNISPQRLVAISNLIHPSLFTVRFLPYTPLQSASVVLRDPVANSRNRGCRCF